ncbi:hypothetical protein AJ78_01579 [Emergomyces pasteurianus Ep9510]|uniref:MutL C-terminal dimerisation domain-containing protein n=1 Tax=Emergomyces pasteurianus Ep9510 TaxID=1447872 RepID=A0A1J9QQE0_9EURO|nr:hypothetical protein AJ78_01579 [Emergomyces pasteurianus Ep9510]
MDVRIPLIQPLPSEVVAQLKSSISISNLNGVVLELFKNSLDAGAQNVTINMDFQKGGCVVEDDGQGILPAEFLEGGNLAKLHHTSKFNSQNEVFGRRGVFLASLVSLSLVTITSCHESSSTTNTVIYHHAKPICRLTPAPLQHELDSRDHGTRVTVTDLFGNLPVRVKHRALSLKTSQDLDREWDDLKRMLTAILLAFQKHVKLVVSDATKTRKLVIRAGNPQYDQSSGTLDLGRIRPILMQAGYITPRDFQSWVTASARTSGVEIQSAISLQPSPTKQVQFISFGINPIILQSNANLLYNEVNRLFSLSRFGVVDDPPIITDGLEGLNLQGDNETIEKDTSGGRNRHSGKSICKWPMFYIRIELQAHDEAIDRGVDFLEPSKTLQSVVDVLVAMIQEFLEEYHFRTRSVTRTKRTRQPQSPTSAAERQVAKRSRSAAPAFISSSASTGPGKDGGHTEELFNTQIKLPDFNHPIRTTHNPRIKDFRCWSRIKSGHESGFEDIWAGLPRSKGVAASNFFKKNHLAQDKRCSYSSPATPAPLDDLKGERLGSRRDADLHTKSASPDQAWVPGFEGLERKNIEGSTDEVIRWIDPSTNMAVLINSRTGQTISKSNQTLTSSRKSSGVQNSETTDHHTRQGNPVPHPTLWIDTFLKEWTNPIFQQSERPVATAFEVPGPHLGGSSKFFLSGAGDSGFLPSSSRFSGRLTKQGLQNAQLIAQVDKKFLLLKLPSFSEANNDGQQQNLVLVDQHAADERCRVEQLFNELCGGAGTISDPSTYYRVNAASLPKPISFKISPQEGELLISNSDYFESWGCYYTLSTSERNYHTVTVNKVPTLIAERCRLEPKLVIDLLRGEIWDRKDHRKRPHISRTQMADSGIREAGNSGNPPKDKMQPTIARHSWLERIGDCPKAIIDLINSRACRSSIMFNDSLGRAECENLVSRLALCAFPFQCAHGRPSMIPIVSLGGIHSSSAIESTRESHSGSDFGSLFGSNSVKAPVTNMDLPFVEACKAWKSDVI